LEALKKGEYFGVMDIEGKIIISPQYLRFELIN
jgi:hypothetical protein